MKRPCSCGSQKTEKIKKAMLLLYLSHLASEKPKKLEKAAFLGFREAKET